MDEMEIVSRKSDNVSEGKLCEFSKSLNFKMMKLLQKRNKNKICLWTMHLKHSQTQKSLYLFRSIKLRVLQGVLWVEFWEELFYLAFAFSIRDSYFEGLVGFLGDTIGRFWFSCCKSWSWLREKYKNIEPDEMLV